MFFITVSCRSRSTILTIPLLNFKLFGQIYILISKLKILLQYLSQVILMHTQFWWPDDDTTPEATEIEEIITKLGLSKLISETTNFEPQKNPSCLDLHNILDSGTRASLDSYCHHQIVHCKVNFRIPPPYHSERKVWPFNRANSAAIKMTSTLTSTPIPTGK